MSPESSKRNESHKLVLHVSEKTEKQTHFFFK